MLSKIRNHKAYTLIELMIALSIIGIMSAIAIPNFLYFQSKAKTAEARNIIGGIRTVQEAFRAEYNAYLNCAAHPVAVPGTMKAAWTLPAPGFDETGFAPYGSVYYQYEVSTNGGIANVGGTGIAGDTEMVICAAGDLDGDLVNGEWGYATNIAAINLCGNIGNNVTINRTVQELAPGVF